MKTAIVILNWNGKSFLERFLPALIASAGPDAEVIVADNASDDGSMEMMKEKFPDVKTMIFSKNFGFTGGYNRALPAIDAEYYILMNSDIEVPPHWLQPLTEWMDNHPDCGACAPKFHSFYERDTFEYAGAAGGYIDKYGYPFCRGRILKNVEKDRGQYDSPAQVFWASGACLMVRASLYKSLGGLDERFFAHMEEIDLCWRIQLEGYKIYTVPASVVYHIGGGTLPNDSPRKLYFNYRNNLLMLQNNLAMTIAVSLRQKGLSSRDSAKKAVGKAGRIIAGRMALDLLSAAAYMLTFKPAYFKSVIRAHRDYRKIKRDIGTNDLTSFVKKKGKLLKIKGIYNRWMIPSALAFPWKTVAAAEKYMNQL